MTSSGDAFRLDGKVALVTGGASGIGEATCKELARAGAAVIAADIDVEKALALVGTLPNARAVRMDVTSRESIGEVAAQIDRLDILVNNAGIAHVGDITHLEPSDFDRMMTMNVTSVYLVTRAFLPLLLEVRGSIVNIGSVAEQVGIKQRFAYCTTKGAVLAMSRQLAVEYSKELRVNCLCPGTVHTPFVEDISKHIIHMRKTKFAGS